MKRVKNIGVTLVLITTILILFFSLGIKNYTNIATTETKQAPLQANWYSEYTYTLNETNKTITLTRYNGTETDITVGASAEINGVTYNTIVSGEANTSLFQNKTNLKSVTFQDGVKGGTTLKFLFSGCTNLTEINFNNFDTSATTSMEAMFNNCSSLTKLDLSSFDTRNVTNMKSMLGLAKIKELNLGNFDTSNIDSNKGMKEFYVGNTQIEKITLGPKTNLHARKDDPAFGNPIGRGIFERIVDANGNPDNTQINAVDIAYRSATENMAGTYIKKTNMINEMSVDSNIKFRIDNTAKIDRFEATSTLFKSTQKEIYIANLPRPTESEHVINETATAWFYDAVDDEEGNKYNLKMQINNIRLYDYNLYTGQNYFIRLAIIKPGEKYISFYNNVGKTENNYTSNGRDVKFDITFTVEDSNGVPQQGNFIFSAYDIDIPSLREADINNGYGNYSEGIELISGFDRNSLKIHPNGYLFSPSNNPNRITGSRTDSGTEFSEFVVTADASGFKFAWSGKQCGTGILSTYQPRIVRIIKKDNNGNNLAGANFELYKGDSNTPIKTWTSSTEAKELFLSPGKYRLREKSSPEGFEPSKDIIFYADASDTLTIDGEVLDEILVTNQPASYQIITKSYGGGSITGDEEVPYGKDSTKDKIVIKAEPGYYIETLIVNGEKIDVEPNQEYMVLDQFLDVREDIIVEVTFTKITNPNTSTSLLTLPIITCLSLLIVGILLRKQIFKKRIYKI